jgi:hypothetical protein
MRFFLLFEKNTNRFKKVKNVTSNHYLIYLCQLKRKRFLKHDFLFFIRVKIKSKLSENLF